jgi:hypothetical protein
MRHQENEWGGDDHATAGRASQIATMSVKKGRPPVLKLEAGLTEIQKLQCIKITNKLLKNPLSLYFRQPVDPVHDNLPDYFDKIKTPMDISTVLQKLSENKYSAVDKWKEDVALIWRNAIYYNGEGSLPASFAHELSEVFKRLCDVIPKTEWELWMVRLRRAHQRLVQYIKARPDAGRAPADAPAETPKPSKPTKILFKHKPKDAQL